MDKKIIIIIVIILSLTLTTLLVTQTTILSSRASNSNSSLPAKNNSYLFASPLQAQGNGEEKIRINVFLLDSSGLGVSQQKVSLNTTPSLTIDPVQPITDDLGKAVFNLSSNLPGKYQITAQTNSFDLNQKINIIFVEPTLP